MLRINLYTHRHALRCTHTLTRPSSAVLVSESTTSEVPTHRSHFIASHAYAQLTIWGVVTVYVCVYVRAEYQPSWSGYLAGILEERWNKREEEIRREGDQTGRR